MELKHLKSESGLSGQSKGIVLKAEDNNNFIWQFIILIYNFNIFILYKIYIL